MRSSAMSLIIVTLIGCQTVEPPVGETLSPQQKEPAVVKPDTPPTSIKPIETATIVETPPTAPDVEQETDSAVRSLDEMLLFFPARYPEGDWEPDDLHYEDVWFASEDRTKLHGWYCPAEKPVAVMLYAHGNGGHLAHRAELLKFLQTELSVSVMMFDYRGYGRSEGVPTVKGVLQDARAACASVIERAGITKQELVLIGRSLGGAVMIDLAAEIQPRLLVVENTFPSLKEVARVHYPRLSWLVPANKLHSTEKVALYTGPFLQSHGEVDRVIPYELGQKLFDAANEPKEFVVIPAGTHNSQQTEDYYRQLLQMLSE